ncbi:MAG TPA: hypothetical protein VL175_02950 [Pirellulales bacterium]|nr:hypothetical protein [Pirellulales bacterium]
MPSSGPTLFRKGPTQVALAAGAFSLIAGGSALAGWAFNLPMLTDWTDQHISMFANAALSAVLAGAALLLQAGAPRSSQLVVARVLSVLVISIAGLTLLEHIIGVDLGIDTLLFNRPWGQGAANAPMRMGLPASLSYLVTGVALVLATLGESSRRIATMLAIVPAAIASLSLTGYWFGENQLFGVAKSTGIALNTSTVIAVLSAGLVAIVPEHGLIAGLDQGSARAVCFCERGGTNPVWQEYRRHLRSNRLRAISGRNGRSVQEERSSRSHLINGHRGHRGPQTRRWNSLFHRQQVSDFRCLGSANLRWRGGNRHHRTNEGRRVVKAGGSSQGRISGHAGT